MANGFETVVESLRHAKKATIEQGVSFGKDHPILKYPVFVLMVAFILAYNFLLHLFIQMNMHNKLSKALAYVLSASLIVSGISVTAFANDEEIVSVKITAFSSLPGDISDQYIYVGDEESKISFPSSLGATIEKTEVITTKREIKKEDQSETVEKLNLQEEPLDDLKPEETIPESKDVTGPELKENDENGNNSESVATEEAVSSEDDNESIVDEEPITETEPVDEPVAEPKQEETPVESDEEPAEVQIEDAPVSENETPDDQARNVFDVLMPSITVYAADSSGDDYLADSTETSEGSETEYETVTETVIKTEETVIDGVTWTIDAASSSAETFSSENAGSKFVYIPVISSNYDVATELPRISVSVIAKEEIIEASSFSHNETVAGYNISIDAPAGVFPNGTTVSVNVVSNPVSLIEGEISDGRNIQQIITFDISFWHEGIEIEPENGAVNVSISLASDMKETLQDDTAEVQIFHIDDDRNVEEVTCSSNGEEVCFSADEFSEYAVVTSTGNSREKIATPTNIRWVEGETLTIAWDAVEHGYSYEVRLFYDGTDTYYSRGVSKTWNQTTQTYESKTSLDLVEFVSSYENYSGNDLNGKQIQVKVQAKVNSSNAEEYLRYLDGDYSELSSPKMYIRGIVIDTDFGTQIVQTDTIFDSLKNSLTSEQLAAAEGKELTFDLNISDLSTTSERATDISNYASTNSYTIGKFFDISLIAKADGVSIGNVTATAAAVPLAVEIPAELQKTGRTFIILRNHDGVITEVGRGTGNQVPVSTDRFSTYAIAYTDSNSDESSNSSDKDSSSNNYTSSNSSSSSNSSNNNSSSSSETATNWTPKTPDEVKRYVVVGKEILAPFVDKSSGYTLTLKNAMQGPGCFAAFESVLNGYTIGRTYDIFPNGQRVQSTDKEIGFSVEVPKALQKDGRTFQMICVTKGGQPVVLKDLDTNPNTITVKTNKFYAFALVYKDSVKTE